MRLLKIYTIRLSLLYISNHFPFFGHSMGSILVYELCCKIKQMHGISPIHLFVSGRKAPPKV
ncbi:thioesterase domain-containing protein [Niallia sp. BSM11]|uniref:thioesterase domain-containing protein n=1 Tax=Niallia sp. BSM11 TaxID=3391576 RepID=UPI003984DDA5